MGKPYINNAVIGNGSMLGCITETGELIRLYWPEIDYPQHLEKMLIGFFDTKNYTSAIWFSEGEHEVHQKYLDSANILETTAFFKKLPVKVIQTDFCLPDLPVMVRHYNLKNIGSEDFQPGVGLASHVISHTHDMGNTMFDFQLDALVHYRHGGCWAISSNLEVKEFQIGNNPFKAVWEGKLNGIDSIGMSPDGAMLWDLGRIPPGGEHSYTLYITFSKTLNELKILTEKIKLMTFQQLLFNTKQYWYDFLKVLPVFKSGNSIADRLYERSLLLFRLMSDKSTGALLASPEIDEGFTQCGRYAYCWCRDAAFITWALDEAGLFSDAEKFYDWAAHVQDLEGFWHQRYHMNGSVAPSWGLQIDETGSMLFGILKHYLYVKDLRFLERMWPSVVKAVSFLEGFIDGDTGLPLPSFDIWEERMGEHTYSTAAVIAGIYSAAEIGELLGYSKESTDSWRQIAQKMRESLENELVDKEKGIFIKSVRTKLNPWGDETSAYTARIRVNPKGFYREVTLVDPKTDISLLGVTVPFNVLRFDYPVVYNTVLEIEKKLHCIKSGGIYRYEDDSYAGGNPWIIAALWLALYYVEAGDIKKSREYFDWVLKCRTHLELLPEQVDKQDGKPCWVIPLTWSHAMYVLVYKKLADMNGL